MKDRKIAATLLILIPRYAILELQKEQPPLHKGLAIK